ncbi:hypothetical protein M426DRAFT_325796 [Hypoxylon sp. CI-4A]|nr:hypothetical protein M426DRAFT_325796 [Hypoxylon sp. CI-4A]
MNWYRGSTATIEPATVKPEGTGKKLRRKLQKIGTQQRWYRPSEHDGAKKDTASAPAPAPVPVPVPVPAPITTIDTTTIKPSLPKPAPRTTLPERPNPNDGKWLEQLRKSGYLCRTQPPAQLNHKPQRHSMQVIPEFAHLSMNDDKPGRQLDKRASCATPSTVSTRRYAKTPVHQIGQLENHARRDPRLDAARRVSSVELIAESYRDLLESSCAILDEKIHEPSSPIRQEIPYHSDITHYSSREDSIHSIPEAVSTTGSPHSDDGTLVAFEEDPIGFKPASIASFSPEPPSPRRHDQRREPIPPPPRLASPGSPSLQICLDLLGRELSSAANGSSLRPSGETSALQVWVMIEAYERLRDKVFDMHLSHEQEQSLDVMLDTWIKALYSVHDKMTGSDGHASESDYGD